MEPFEDYFYIVNYRGDPKGKKYWVPGTWLINIEDVPYATYVYYNPESSDIKAPPHSILMQLIEEDLSGKNKVKGRVYFADILGRFGKYKHIFCSFTQKNKIYHWRHFQSYFIYNLQFLSQ